VACARQCDRNIAFKKLPLAQCLNADCGRAAFLGWVWAQNGFWVALIVLLAALARNLSCSVGKGAGGA